LPKNNKPTHNARHEPTSHLVVTALNVITPPRNNNNSNSSVCVDATTRGNE
jgi:hypothetical protein